MTRETKPRITIRYTQETGRADRLALFVGIMRQRPEVGSAILKASGTVESVMRESTELEGGQRDTFVGRFQLAAADVFANGDDLAFTPDPETELTVQAGLAEASMGKWPYDTRIQSMAALCCAWAEWQVDHPYEGPRLDDGPGFDLDDQPNLAIVIPFPGAHLATNGLPPAA